MNLPNSQNSEGFTLMEIMLVLVIVSILAAISAPSLLGMYNRGELNNSVIQLRGALEEAQRQAIRRSQGCSITINTASKIITSANGCLLSNRQLSSKLTTINTGGSSTISFDFNGNVTLTGTPTPGHQTIQLSVEGVNDIKCVKIFAPLGLAKTGNISGSSCVP